MGISNSPNVFLAAIVRFGISCRRGFSISASIPFDASSSEPIAHLDPLEAPRAHPLREHLAAVGALAAQFASSFTSADVAGLAGRLHDVGKFSAKFQTDIRLENGYVAHIEGDTSGPRDHSTAGAILGHSLDHLHGDVRVALAFIIAGHHAGLGDPQELTRRLSNLTLLEAALKGGFQRSDAEATVAQRPAWLPLVTDSGFKHRTEMWIRMLFSCLCDADFLDTEAFYDRSRSHLREGWPELVSLKSKLTTYLDDVERRAPRTEVNLVRSAIREGVRSCAESRPGFFTLTVPTGGGKTFAAMDFALQHAAIHGLERVIVAVPLTAIIEQNAEAYRRALGDEAVLEHHSLVDIDDPRRETPRTRVAAENWNAPIVVTTTVQLFESLFANRPSRCRNCTMWRRASSFSMRPKLSPYSYSIRFLTVSKFSCGTTG